jgi:hypothetical protein
MIYLPAHTFEPYHDEANYCGIPRGDSICAKRADHPVHATDRPEVEELARTLLRREWGPNKPWSVHAEHDYAHDCALCTKDVHAIAAAVLDILGVKP